MTYMYVSDMDGTEMEVGARQEKMEGGSKRETQMYRQMYRRTNRGIYRHILTKAEKSKT